MPTKKKAGKKELKKAGRQLKKVDDKELDKVEGAALAVGPYDRYPASMGGYYTPEMQRRGAMGHAWAFAPGGRRRNPFGR
jgi:hypothetical protein